MYCICCVNRIFNSLVNSYYSKQEFTLYAGMVRSSPAAETREIVNCSFLRRILLTVLSFAAVSSRRGELTAAEFKLYPILILFKMSPSTDYACKSRIFVPAGPFKTFSY